MVTKQWASLVVVALCATLAACGGKNNDSGNNTTNVTPNNMTTSTNNNMSNQNVMTNCDAVQTCDTAGSSCSGSSSVVCAADANGCLVETTTDCTATSQMCMGGACIDVQPCMDDPACTGLMDGSRFCAGDVLTTCADNGAGCLVPSTNDCANAGQVCDMDTQACIGACTDDIACDGLTAGDSYCDGTGYVTCDENSQGCLVPTITACNAGEVCDDTAGAATCGAACTEAIRTLSCADAGASIAVDSANGTNVVTDNGCNFLGDTYDAMEVFLVFQDAGNNDISIDFTWDNANIDEVDAFALLGDGVCTDEALTCENYDWATTSPGTLTFGAAANQAYYVLLEPYQATGETTNYGITITCTPPVCGDSTIGAGEECDDGNAADGDGCSSACAIEANYLCTGEPSVCIEEICGDGVITRNEECDDNNALDGDGCDMNCAEEAGYICSGEPSNCIPDVCGDGTLSPNEVCDDANLVDGDGCAADCTVEFGYECDATGANCAMLPSIGSFGAGDAIPNTTGGPITGGESDRYLITFTEDVLIAGTATRGTTGDIDLGFYAATGYVGGSAVDGDESFSGLFLAAGTYVVRLNAYDGFGAGDVDTYTLALSTTAFAPTDKGTFAAAAAITDSTGALTAGETVYFSVTFSDDVFVSGSLTADTGDGDLYIYTTTGQLFTSIDTIGDETFTDIPLPAGTYYFGVTAYQPDGDIGTYTLAMSTTAITSTDLGSFAAGGTIADVTGTLLDGESDWYKITFSTDVTLMGTLGGNTTGETGVFIYNSTAFPVTEFNLGDETFNAATAAGTYLIRVASNPGDGDVDAYTLTLDPN